MVGIVAYGAYVPRLRLNRQAVYDANKWFAAGLRGVPPQSVFLHFKAEAFAFLFPTAHPCQRDELFHGDYPEDKTPYKRPTFKIIVTASSGVTIAS